MAKPLRPGPLVARHNHGGLRMNLDAELVRSRADLVGVAARYGVKLRKSGVQLAGICPFHDEKIPSFYIHPAKQVFKCHGCGAGGDVFSFVQRIEHVDFLPALAIVADLAGVHPSGKPWTKQQRREYAVRQEDRELIEHFRMIEAYPERESDRAAAAFRTTCEADLEYREWLREDLEHAKATCALIVVMIARAQRRDGCCPAEGHAA